MSQWAGKSDEKVIKEALEVYVYTVLRGFYEQSREVAKGLFKETTGPDKAKFFKFPIFFNEKKFYKELLSAVLLNTHIIFIKGCENLNLDQRLNIDEISVFGTRESLRDWGLAEGYKDDELKKIWMGTRKYFEHASKVNKEPFDFAIAAVIAAMFVQELMPQPTIEQRKLASLDVTFFLARWGGGVTAGLNRLSELNYNIKLYLKDNQNKD